MKRDDSAKKADGDKLRYDLVPADALERLVGVFTLGARKYGDRNWEQGFDYTRVYAAMMRHLQAWYMGEEYDQEDGQHHLAAVAWGAFVLLHFQLSGPTMDDRPIGPSSLAGTASGLSTPR